MVGLTGGPGEPVDGRMAVGGGRSRSGHALRRKSSSAASCPAYTGGLVRLDGSGRFTGCRGSCACKEFHNGATVYLIHVLRRAADSGEGDPTLPDEVMLGTGAWEAYRDSREASQVVGMGEGWLG
jgi:hypothetical protein